MRPDRARYVYLWAAGVHPQDRVEDEHQCSIVLICAAAGGHKKFIGFQAGFRENAQCWRELLADLKSRGLTIAPKLAVGDSVMGFWKALDEVFPGVRQQRCWVHRTANVLNKVPKSRHKQSKSDVQAIWMANSRADGDDALATFEAK